MNSECSQSSNDSNEANPDSVPEGFRTINNRRFATGNTKYLLPSDTEDMSRLDYQHYVIRQLMHGNFNAPLEAELQKGIRVLDVGCGTGRWTVEMAEDYPNSTFFATDCTQNYPQKDFPSNCTFMKANTLEGLPFPDNTFDYVFQRLMMVCFSPEDWRTAARELFRITKPGGMIELTETDFQVKRAPAAYTRFYNGVLAATAARGIDLSIIRHLGELLTNAGFENAETDFVSCPMGWQGRLGDLSLKTTTLSFKALKSTVGSIMGVSDEEYERILEEIFDGFRRKKSWVDAPYALAWKPKRRKK